MVERSGARPWKRRAERAAAPRARDASRTHRELPSSPEHLDNHRELVSARRPGRIIVLTDLHDQPLIEAVAACLAAFDVPLLVVRVRPRRVELPASTAQVRYVEVASPAELPKRLWREAGASVMIELVGPGSIKGRVMAQALYPLADGGLYVIHHLPDVGSESSDFTRADLEAVIAADGELTASVARLSRHGQSVVIDKQGRHVYKLRDAQLVSGSFERRLGLDWGSELDCRPAEEFVSRASVGVNRPEHRVRFGEQMTVRARYLRDYRDVVCGPRQLVRRAGLAMPVSFHHPGRESQYVQGNVLVDANVDRVLEPEPTVELSGTYFHLVSEFPGHFGHVMTEDLGRMWGWFRAKALHPGCRLLVSAEEPGSTVRPFQRVLLEALGVEPEDIVCITAPARVERLIGAGPQFHNRRFVDPALAQVWDRIREVLQPEPDLGGPARIFVTRPPGGTRNCLNGAELEQRFVDHGFILVRPETLSLPEQVRIFSNAEVIAGYGGSGLFSGIYSRRPGRRIVVSASTYTASNEYLIASVKGDDYHHFWCDAELAHPEGGWVEEAFFSDFTFDFDRDGPGLTRLLETASGR